MRSYYFFIIGQLILALVIICLLVVSIVKIQKKDKLSFLYLAICLLLIIMSVNNVHNRLQSISLEGWQVGHKVELDVTPTQSRLYISVYDDQAFHVPDKVEIKVMEDDRLLYHDLLDSWETGDSHGAYKTAFDTSLLYRLPFYKALDKGDLKVNIIYYNQPHVLELEPSFEEVYGDE